MICRDAGLSGATGGAMLHLMMLKSSMTDPRTTPYAALLLRASLGVMFLAHAAVKLFIFTPSGTAGFFGSLGLPPALAYLVMTAEVVGGVALVLGVWTRIVALMLTPILLGAIVTVHGASGWLFTNPGGGWEYPAFWRSASSPWRASAMAPGPCCLPPLSVCRHDARSPDRLDNQKTPRLDL